MISRIIQHINATTVLAFIALIFATTGGALAVNDHGGAGTKAASATPSVGNSATAPVAITSKAKSKAKIKSKVGPRGPAGAAGAAGAAGKNGTNGASGSQGEKGPAGTNGTSGTNGESVTVSTPSGSECKGEGGAKVSNASGSATACNGKTGYTPTLPAGQTETGTWSLAVTSKGYVAIPLSFSIPLAPGTPGEPVIENVHYFEAGATASGHGCGKGTAEKPEAEPGNLCVYTGEAEPGIILPENVHLTDPANGKEGAGSAGANLKIYIEEAPGGLAHGGGTWAVSAPE